MLLKMGLNTIQSINQSINQSIKTLFFSQGKKLPPSVTDGEVSDEDEAAEANNNHEKQKKKSNLKLSVELSKCVGMKSVHFGGLENIPRGRFRYIACSYICSLLLH